MGRCERDDDVAQVRRRLSMELNDWSVSAEELGLGHSMEVDWRCTCTQGRSTYMKSNEEQPGNATLFHRDTSALRTVLGPPMSLGP